MKGGGISTYEEFKDFLHIRVPLIPMQFDRNSDNPLSFGKEPYLLQILYGIHVMTGISLEDLHKAYVRQYKTATIQKNKELMMEIIYTIHDAARDALHEYVQKKKS